MKPKTIILMVVAVVCGLGASYMTSRLLAERGSATVEIEKVSVLVAKKNLKMGEAIKEKNLDQMFELKEYLRGEEPKDALTSLDQLKDKYVKRNLRKGDFVTPSDIGETPTVLPVPEGMRAVGLRVNMETIAGGFASLPGSRVDIFSTVRRGTDEQTYSSILLENVLVLAADTNVKHEGGAIPANVVTVALTPEDALRVTLAKDLGSLTLALRGSGDSGSSEVRKISAKDQFSGKFHRDDEPSPPPVVQTPPKEEKKEQPTVRPYPVYITVGDRTTTKVYYEDDKGKILVGGVEGELPPTPPAIAPRPGGPPAVPAPAPTADDTQGTRSKA